VNDVRRRRAPLLASIAWAAIAATGCVGAGESRALDELEVGSAAAGGVQWEVEGGLAHVRAITLGQVTLWAQAPDLRFEVVAAADAVLDWEVAVENCMPDAELTSDDPEVLVEALGGPRPTSRRFAVTLPAGRTVALRLAPPDADALEVWRFAAMGDIQTAMYRVDDVFERINRHPDVRFVVGLGDLVESATIAEYDLLAEKLTVLEVPMFSTIGNHELFADPRRWLERFGRYNLHFAFKGVSFSLIDSGNAAISPTVYEWLAGWLADVKEEGRLHVFGTHYPPLDPVGVRSGSFRSRAEAAKLISMLAAGGVDLTLYGHIHSYYAFENAGIPAYITGGGGAWPELWDGVGRHFLAVDVDPAAREILDVALVRVD
jgi:3',5'-cyclic-AMP phosphodiesterase